jgi:hypothetical protein
LVAKAVRDLRKRLDNPVIVVSVPEGYSGADFGLDQAPPIAARRFGGEIRASGVTAVE